MAERLETARLLFSSLIAMFALSGCATTGLLAPFAGRAKFDKATSSNPAVRCLCVWQSGEGFGSDGKPCRGVAGQVFFFNRNSVTPVVVDGEVRVFLFDDQGTPEEQTRPIHQFDIESAVWQGQLISTQFGPAYQVFVPYTQQGRHQAQLALRVRLTPVSGPVVYSDLASIEMPGYDISKLAAKSSSESPETTSRPQRVASRPALGLEERQRTDGLTTTIATIRPEERQRRTPVPPSAPDSAQFSVSDGQSAGSMVRMR